MLYRYDPDVGRKLPVASIKNTAGKEEKLQSFFKVKQRDSLGCYLFPKNDGLVKSPSQTKDG